MIGVCSAYGRVRGWGCLRSWTPQSMLQVLVNDLNATQAYRYTPPRCSFSSFTTGMSLPTELTLDAPMGTCSPVASRDGDCVPVTPLDDMMMVVKVGEGVIDGRISEASPSTF